MRAILMISCAALGLAACNGNNSAANNDINAMAADNMTTGDNMMLDQNAAMPGGADANVTTNEATEANMMAKDLNTNDPDTNLQNGM